MESATASRCEQGQSRVFQEALLTPVLDTGHSEVLRRHVLGGEKHKKSPVSGTCPKHTTYVTAQSTCAAVHSSLMVRGTDVEY